MHQRVRAEIEALAWARPIIVLDGARCAGCAATRACLSWAAKRVTESAKLELLMQMLEELLPEGRRVLLFSVH